MSHEETTPSAPIAIPASTTIEARPPPQGRASSYLHSLRKAELDSSASTPSADSDWVSPFTLPPLPAFQRTRNQPPKSPEQHRRSNSSLFYAAAWGSPYATPPSPKLRSPESGGHSAGKSLDSAQASPSRFGGEWLRSLSTKGASVAQYLYSPKQSTTDVDLPTRPRPRSPNKEQSERPNWLSDSEGSDTEHLPGEERSKTPTRALFSRLRTGSFNKAIGHRNQESNITVTPENFNAQPRTPQQLKALSTTEISNMAAVGEMHERYSGTSEAPEREKPLPLLPPRKLSATQLDPVAGSPTSPTRSRVGSLQSFQRPKRQVLWRGKKCIIALPLQSREEAGLPPLLSLSEIEARIREWQKSGYNIDGFVLGDSLNEDSSHGTGHSRPLFPDPGETARERQDGKFFVHVPNQAEWDAWVDYLKEEKLRALGVTLSNSEPPPSTRSPFSASISQGSSQNLGLAVSPPNPPSSGASNAIRLSNNRFSPSFNTSPVINSQAAPTKSPLQYPQLPSQTHSTPQLGGPGSVGLQMTSPFDSVVHRIQSPLYGLQRSLNPSPAGLGSLPSLDEVLSPVSPFNVDDLIPLNQTDPLVEQMRRQQISKGNKQPFIPVVLPTTPRDEPFIESSLEIAHPTPRSHRHNLSEALQREVDDREVLQGKVTEDAVHATPGVDATESSTQDLKQEEDEDPLPILQHPESLMNPEDNADIITNPSNEPSPLPREERDPLANWPVTVKSQSDFMRAHKMAQSVSKLNVEAPEFDPKGTFTASNFPFVENSFAPPSSRQAPPIFGVKSDQKPAALPPVLSHLNADAPSFTPSFSSKPTPSTKAFAFSSATFNVEAPEFNPSASVTENFRTSVTSSSETEKPSNRIFGEVIIDPSSKVTRRSSKAVAITRPRSKDGPQDNEEEDIDEDEQGRPQAPAERQKRMRRGGSDGDQSPLFADSAPFTHGKILSEILNEADSQGPRESPLIEKNGNAASMPPEQGNEDIENREPPSAQDESSPSNPWSPFTFRNGKDVADFNTARPMSKRSLKYSDELKPDETEPALEAQSVPDIPLKSTETVETDTPATESEPASKPKAGLSPFAPPFEFKQSMPAEFTQKSVPEIRKPSGLMASRFAPSPSPPASPPSRAQHMASPPPELYSYIKPEDASPSVRDHNTNIAVHEPPSPSPEEKLPSQGDEIIVEIEETGDEQDKSRSMSISPTSERRSDEDVPSYEEIDAVIKHLEENPELGVERSATPPVLSTPLIDMRIPPNFRSDAPSPSPRRSQQDGRRSDKVAELGALESHPFGLGLGVHKLTDGTETVSDWNDTLSPSQESKLRTRAHFFDGHVNDLVDGILETRLEPLRQTLQTIEQSLASIMESPRGQHGRRSMSTDAKDSDADDEEEYDAFEGYVDYRTRSPVSRRERKADRMKQVVMEAMATHQVPPQQPQGTDISEVRAALEEMRELMRGANPETRHAELKSVVEEVIATHPRLRGQRFQSNQESEDKYRLQVNGLETMLKVANERADEEATHRREADSTIVDLQQRLKVAEGEAAQHRESSEEAERSLQAFVREKAAYEDLERTVSDLEEENKALKNTLQEYRQSHQHWQEEIHRLKNRTESLEDAADLARQNARQEWEDELRRIRLENDDLQHALAHARDQLHERTRSREAHRDTVDRLRVEISNLAQSIAAERSDWQKSDHEMRVKHNTTVAALEQERRRREKIEQELDDLYKDHQETLKLRTSHAHAQEEIAHLQKLITTMRDEHKAHQESAFKLERELTLTRDATGSEVTKATAKLQIELERANAQLLNARTDAEAQIARLQARLDNAELDLEDQKAKHDAILAETIEKHSLALQEATEKGENALQEQHSAHERKLNDLRERHTRALHNSSDDRHRLEHHLNEKLCLSDDKVKHLESKVVDLEERLEITKSAARAAVEAATRKGVDLPTPAPSTMASPPHQPSLTFITGTDIPEKISPQALRESIMVLQDQLQNREQAIEKLEQELAGVDKDAPKKIQGLETEIGWLRELLAVRVDDIDEVVNVLSQDDFDRNAAKDAAIRLRANLQMETQLKQRAMSASNALSGLPTSLSLPSIASLSSTLTQSPRALPMAAAAAWGNWRKARDSSFGALSDLTSGLGGNQATPSKSTAAGSPGSSFLGGIMTPPGTSFKSPPPAHAESSAMALPARPLAGIGPVRKGSGEARPLRAYNSQPRALNANKGKEKDLELPAPQTPTTKGRTLSDASDLSSAHRESAERPSLGFADDIDEDASPLDGKGEGW